MSEISYSRIKKCRVCRKDDLVSIHAFGAVPIADRLVDSSDIEAPSIELTLAFCSNCSHLQILENVDPNALFCRNYPYYSSKIPEVAKHFRDTFESINKRVKVDNNELVVELASNDGVLIRHFKEFTENLLCIEPSPEHAIITKHLGFRTLQSFFGSELAGNLKRAGEKAKIIMANNVLAHVPDPLDFVKGIEKLLSPDGMAIVEVPHAVNMVRNCTFDVIFHQHYSYFNMHSLVHLFRSVGLHINEIEKIPPQGGSLRLFISRSDRVSNEVREILGSEKTEGFLNENIYREFSGRIDAFGRELIKLLREIKKEGKTIVGYGAAGKASTFLNYFGIGRNHIDYLVDISDNKHFKYFPNTGLQILPVETLYKDSPDYIVILAWNYTESIKNNLAGIREKGTKLITPHPEISII